MSERQADVSCFINFAIVVCVKYDKNATEAISINMVISKLGLLKASILYLRLLIIVFEKSLESKLYNCTRR